MPDPVIDMRSDTVTRPSPGMREAMATAEVGDDMFGEDPTVNRLESRMCELLGKEAAVIACSGTQSNQMGVRTHCIPGDELLIEATGHIANFEGGAPAALSGVSCRLVPGRHGMLDIADLEGKIRADNQHFTHSRLLCLENTTNVGGGRVYPLDQIARVCGWAHEQGLKTHLDGARFFNAVTAGGYSAADLAKHFDTISICFSKGLGCPMGSVLVGSTQDIYRARRIRKIFGGAMRQAGVMAAACLYALDHNVQGLQHDHVHAQAFAAALREIPGVTVDPPDVQTNIVFFDLDPQRGTAAQLSAELKRRNVLISSSGPQRLRGCTHLDVDRSGVLTAARAIAETIHNGFADTTSGVDHGPYARG
jgi:threonine aldolase